MQSLSIAATQVVEHSKENPIRPSASRPLLAPQAKLDDAGLPVVCDPDLDVALHRSVLCWKESGGKWVIRRDLTLRERAALLARLGALEQATAPHKPSEKERITGALHVMLGGFRNMRDRDVNASSNVEVAAIVLREFPAWAIEKACFRIASGKADLRHPYPPNDQEIAMVAERIIEPYRSARYAANALLTAKVERQRPLRPQPPQPPEPPTPTSRGHGGHIRRVLADIEARKNRNEARAADEQKPKPVESAVD